MTSYMEKQVKEKKLYKIGNNFTSKKKKVRRSNEYTCSPIPIMIL